MAAAALPAAIDSPNTGPDRSSDAPATAVMSRIPMIIAPSLSSTSRVRLMGLASSRSMVCRSSSPATAAFPADTAYRMTRIGPMKDISSTFA